MENGSDRRIDAGVLMRGKAFDDEIPAARRAACDSSQQQSELPFSKIGQPLSSWVMRGGACSIVRRPAALPVTHSNRAQETVGACLERNKHCCDGRRKQNTTYHVITLPAH